MLNLIKFVHTIVWIIMTAAVLFIGYSVARMEFETLFFVSLALISAEIVIILINAWTCPLTNIARRYSDNAAPNFDIFLPEWLAKYNKEIFSVILACILLLYFINAVR